MSNLKFLNSVRVKFVIIFVLLIFISMQIIRVYFVQKLESEMISSFQSTLKERISLLEHVVEEEMSKKRDESEPLLGEAIQAKLADFSTEESKNNIREIQVIDRNLIVIGTSDETNQGIVGKSSTANLVKISLKNQRDSREMIDSKGNRIWVLTEPITSNQEVIGCLLVVSNIENVYTQINDINIILQKGTFISLAITAVIGLLISQMITIPITEIRKQAEAMTKGNYSRKTRVYGNDEIGQLAETFNDLSRQLQDAQSTTEAEKRKLSSVLANMSDGVIATDRRGRVILINEPALKMLNISQEDALSQPIVQILDIENEYTFEALLDRKDPLVLDYSENNKLFYLNANFSVIQRETGFINGLISVLHDVTEQEKIEEDRKEFVANVSHELRTPLTTIKSYLEALDEKTLKNQPLTTKFLNVTREETERMIRLVNDLLQLAKMEQQEKILNLQWVDFNKFFNRIIDRFEMSKNRNVSFVRNIPNESIVVEIDADKINQVIDNIISNALKYSPEGGEITYKLKILENQIEISIKDQGMGMPKGNVDRIFERFYRVDKARSRKMGGTGLGLAIAKEIIQAHKGKIFARSIEGKGTAIIFRLPYEKIQEDDWE